ncbi:YIP1 family protein [Agaribacter flavus]|uniref:YIP1 family protein n=1 Tax=Agaribacter flavus TaxID=1902781 RepID=A0ABV7FJT4_9ALTE
MESEQTKEISNPIQAASEVFYRPQAVFNTIGKVNNWSWIPFIIVTALLFIPSYLYYGMVDLDWLIHQMALANDPEASPAELENFKSQLPKEAIIWSAYGIPIGVAIVNAIIAGYYTLVTRNDEENVQGYMDWYGAGWWILMPTVVNGLIACILLALQAHGTQVSPAIVSPLSLAFMFGVEITSGWFNFLSSVRLDSFWSILLAGYCINCWTSYSFQKSLILAAVPSLFIWLLSFMFAL